MALTELQKKHGPWAQPSNFRAGDYTITCTVADRLPKIKTSTDIEWLRAVVGDQDEGVTVRRAAERRIRKLRQR
jgi:hypothetical protein